MKRGDFVTAKVVGDDRTFIRQGIVTDIYPDGTLSVMGESAEEWHCDANATVVPDDNLWGSVLDFVNTMRTQNQADWYYTFDYKPVVGHQIKRYQTTEEE